MKASSIQFLNLSVVKKIHPSNLYEDRVVLIEPSLLTDRKSIIGIKIVSLTRCIGLGICLKKKEIDNNFSFE